MGVVPSSKEIQRVSGGGRRRRPENFDIRPPQAAENFAFLASETMIFTVKNVNLEHQIQKFSACGGPVVTSRFIISKV